MSVLAGVKRAGPEPPPPPPSGSRVGSRGPWAVGMGPRGDSAAPVCGHPVPVINVSPSHESLAPGFQYQRQSLPATYTRRVSGARARGRRVLMGASESGP